MNAIDILVLYVLAGVVLVTIAALAGAVFVARQSAPPATSPINPHLRRGDPRLFEERPPATWKDRLRCLLQGHEHPRWQPNYRMRKHLARRFRLSRWPDEHSFPLGDCRRCGRAP